MNQFAGNQYNYALFRNADNWFLKTIVRLKFITYDLNKIESGLKTVKFKPELKNKHLFKCIVSKNGGFNKLVSLPFLISFKLH